jgi:flagellum-specific ATP synthase
MNTAVSLDLLRNLQKLPRHGWVRSEGRVTRVIGLTVESTGPRASVGDLAWIETGPVEARERIPAEVVGFHERSVILMPIEHAAGIRPGDRVLPAGAMRMAIGPGLLGRVLDGLGRPIDGGPMPDNLDANLEIDRPPPPPLERTLITTPFHTGVRAIDACITCAKGQRVGIFAGSGVGKSVLLGSLARHAESTVNVIALIGERGREVRDFVEKNLGNGMQKSVVVAVTSDQTPLMRRKGASTAMAIAEYFRDRGDDVLLMMDSVTRFAMAQREIGLAVGEPPTSRGYPPSVFGLMARLLERPGTSANGTITAFFSVLVEGDDLNDPIADSVRSILDGHIVLSREIAEANHYPAIDVLRSVSRLMSDVISPRQKQMAAKMRELLSVYRKAEDLVNVGAYVAGTNPKIDEALAKIEAINQFLRQTPQEVTNPDALQNVMEQALA